MFRVFALAGAALAAEGTNWDYKQNGKDWGKLYDACNGGNQSPIDLTKNAPRIEYKNDFNKIYTAMSSAVPNLFDGYGSVAMYDYSKSYDPNGF